MLSNSANAEDTFYYAIEAVLGDTCLPWFWMNYIPYDRPELRVQSARERPVAPCRE
jgi:hypothetical protein